MDKESEAAAKDYQGSIEAEYGNNPQAYSRRPGRRQKKKAKPPEAVVLLLKTVRHFLGGLSNKMNSIADPRRGDQCVYSQAHLLWLGILLFLTHLGSRRQMRFERLADAFLQNIGNLSGQRHLNFVADPDTLAYYARHLPVESMEKLLAWMTRRLIRMKALDPFRLLEHFTVAIDGSQITTFSREPWPGCPHRKLSDGSTQYFAYVLDAKLVTPCGMALTLVSEMLTNEGNEVFDKQDCELKAFPRLVKKLYELFPRTQLCLLLDSLYASQHVIRLIESKHWKYIITFKKGAMPERFAEAVTLAGIQKDHRLRVKHPKAVQRISWAKALPIAEFTPNVLFCNEQPCSGEARRFVWLTNFHLCSNNVEKIANKGGRLRWKIENEGFNTQKNNGYEMQHPYSEHVNGFKVFYYLLLIAHYITQLILHGSLIKSLCKTFGSAKNFARRLAESMRNHIAPADLALPGQIRLQPT